MAQNERALANPLRGLAAGRRKVLCGPIWLVRVDAVCVSRPRARAHRLELVHIRVSLHDSLLCKFGRVWTFVI